MTVDRIDIICDDWHHARGKIAKIQTFAYYADIDSWVDVPYRGRSRAYQHTGNTRHRSGRMWSERGPRFVTAMRASCAPAGRGAPRWYAPRRRCNGYWTPLRRRV